MDFTMREATKDDIEQVAYVHHVAWMETYTGLIDPQFLKTRSFEKSIQIFKKTNCQNVVVACRGNQIVGFCSYGKVQEEEIIYGEIQGLYVLKEFQHQGIGFQLVEYVKKHLLLMGFQKIYLWVLKKNSQAIHFYERIGFLFDGNERKEWLGGEVVEKRYFYDLSSI